MTKKRKAVKAESKNSNQKKTVELEKKITEIQDVFQTPLEWAFGGHWSAKMTTQTTQGTEKGCRKVTLGCLWDHV